MKVLGSTPTPAARRSLPRPSRWSSPYAPARTGGLGVPTRAHVGAILVALIVLPIALLARRPDVFLLLAVPATIPRGVGVATRPARTPSVRTHLQPDGRQRRRPPSAGTPMSPLPAGARRCLCRGRADPLPPARRASGARRRRAPGPRGPEPIELVLSLVATRWGRYERPVPRSSRSPPISARSVGAPGSCPTLRSSSCRRRSFQPHRYAASPRCHRPTAANAAAREATSRPCVPMVEATGSLRIDWRVSTPARASSRSARCTLISTRQVLLVVDAFHDLGASGGIAGAASNLDALRSGRRPRSRALSAGR